MEKNKYFLITIDTEADNQWDSKHDCTTANSKFLPRFQELAEKYNYKPTWLTTYEMANDDFFVDYFKDKQEKGLCEIGMHLHAWNNPPEYELKSINDSRSYLIEYPDDIMEAKIKMLDELLTEKFCMKPISHRAGRWAMNEKYFKFLYKYGYRVDCSVTPHINWKKSVGSTGTPGADYSNESEYENIKNGILELPVTIKKIHAFQPRRVKNFKSFIKECVFLVKGRNQWVRPDSSHSIDGIKKVIDKCNNKKEYIMFMIHSSELMAGGNPNFKSEEDIEKLYSIIERIFTYVNNMGYKGITLRDYYYLKNGGE